MDDVNYLDWTSLALIVVGALNWGLQGLGYFVEENLNIINLVFDGALGAPELEAALYLLVGLAGLYQVYFGYELYEKQ